jgi:hypothetical protein
MTAVFENSRIRFPYPENWKITEDASVEPPTVTVQSPSSGFWTLVLYSDDRDPDELTEQVVAAMAEEYPALESNRTTLKVGDFEVPGYEMDFSCLDLIVSAKTFAVRHNSMTLLILWQGETRDYDELELVFQAITYGMLQSKGNE